MGKRGATIEVDGVSRGYGDFQALDEVSFTAQPGRVTGFLGPNGAGKTTCLRILVGLTHADRGAARIGGHDYRTLPNPARHVGVLLDASAQHAGRTGREILGVTAETIGVAKDRVEQLLAQVGLDGREGRRRVRNYSLGMRQRLGIAHALLGDPGVLVLDEPANGLDPAGIHWMRGLLRDFAAQGGTVLLSSHLLHEVELIADELVLIGRGRIVASGTRDQLLRTTGSVVRAEDPVALDAALRDARVAAVRHDDGSLRVELDPVEVGRIAAGAGVVLAELRRHEGAGLEDLFLQLTAADARESVVGAS